MTQQTADLAVVGAGTLGGWASVFASMSGARDVVVLERDLAGQGASSRAAGVVRAQGGTPDTVRLGTWSIDFYRGQQEVFGTDSGFRELGYVSSRARRPRNRKRTSASRCSARSASTSAGRDRARSAD